MTKMQNHGQRCSRTMAVLNDDQLLGWTELTGKEFEFPQNMGFGGRGGPGGPPPGN